jgi:hypothetical protein
MEQKLVFGKNFSRKQFNQIGKFNNGKQDGEWKFLRKRK